MVDFNQVARQHETTLGLGGATGAIQTDGQSGFFTKSNDCPLCPRFVRIRNRRLQKSKLLHPS